MSDLVSAGFLNINKPLQLTSHDVVAAVRRRYRAQTGEKKVGHAGTLDPLADGVLVVCLGTATRLSEYMMQSRKVYRAKITFGATTSTYDAAGEVLSEGDASHIAAPDVKRVLPRFIGEIHQIPPMYSAVKVKGKKLYELAREGKSIDRPARTVTIHTIDVLSWENPVLSLEIQCTAGTYIRSLANDLGEALDVGAYLSGLTRVASGDFHLCKSISLDTVLEDDEWMQHIISPYEALSQQIRVTLTADEIQRVQQGGFISSRQELQSSTIFAFDENQQLIAVLQPRDQLWKPHKVFPRRS